jgi:hypothetical protein
VIRSPAIDARRRSSRGASKNRLAGVLALQAREGEAACVVNADVIAGGPKQNQVAGFIVDALGQTLLGRQNGRLGRPKNAIEPPHYNERQDYPAIFGLLENHRARFLQSTNEPRF